MIALPELLYASIFIFFVSYVGINFLFQRGSSHHEPDPHLLYNSDSTDTDQGEEEEDEYKDVTEPVETPSTPIKSRPEPRRSSEESSVPASPASEKSRSSSASFNGLGKSSSRSSVTSHQSSEASSRKSSTSAKERARLLKEVSIASSDPMVIRSHSADIILPPEHTPQPEDIKRASWHYIRTDSVTEASENGFEEVKAQATKRDAVLDLIDICDNLPRPTITCTGADKIELLPQENQR